MPAELSEADLRLRTRTRRALALVGLLLLCFLILAFFLQVTGAVTASGEVAVESSVKTIAHPSGGVLIAISVHDGDHVTEGQELLRFDSSVSQVGSASASQGLEGLLGTRARLEAERDGAGAISFPPELANSKDPGVQEIMARERRLFALRMQDRRGALSLLTERVNQYEDQIRGYQAQIAAIDDQVKLIEPELAGLRELYAKQLVTLGRINQLERTAVQLRGSRAELTANISQTRARISETREQMLNIDKTSRSEAGTQLAAVMAQLNEQQVRLASAQDTHGRSVIRAPQSGTIDKLAYTTIGSAVPPNQPILQIVPDRDALIVTARVRPAEVEQLRLGQKARVTFPGLDRQTTPDLAGTLIFISADLAQDQHSGQSFYRIKVRLNPDQAPMISRLALKPGMPAEVFVETGDRSILSFILKPLFDQLRHAFREG
ncbi:HlyD family type I secretion periplasmic adaptor subunit [Sphingomonas sp. LB-2]|uniref:HlyD family type I secretion periplasmic adaptor subunit n=1 Tax=Sphingomonas caeni TaxID=2984949 RepID=UPI002230C72C|nr:HlyD family type I secretion periplasmic adaptor subunit [Sphingomonas caeni]MCW3849420.1 HlyD family type I secretion periplasmic adaptor subunit [Sphingomonas caeni]